MSNKKKQQVQDFLLNNTKKLSLYLAPFYTRQGVIAAFIAEKNEWW